MRLLSVIITFHIFSENWIHISAGAGPLDPDAEPEFNDKTCIYDRDCVLRGSTECTVCAEDKKAGGRRCFAKFLNDVWFKKELCEAPDTCHFQCNSGRCVVGGDNYQPACLCDNAHGDVYCRHPQGPGEILIRMLQWKRTNIYANPGETKRYEFRICGRSVLKSNMRRYFFTTLKKEEALGKKGYKTQQEPTIQKFTFEDKDIEQLCADDYIELPLPYLLPDNEYGIEVLQSGDKLRGYLAIVGMIYKRGGSNRDVKRKFNVFVKYTELDCIALVQLTNCARDKDNATQFVFHRNVDVVIDYNVKYLENGGYLSKAKENRQECSDKDTTWTWTWFKTKPSADFSGLIETRFIDKSIKQRRIFEKFSLEFGVYKVNLRIKRVIHSSTNENYDECFFQVKPLPLKAVIEGGSARQIIKDSGITLVAKQSYDPNQPPNQQLIKIRWSCECLTNEIPNCENTCKRRFSWISVNQEFFVPGHLLQYEAQYRFTLTVDSHIKYNDKKIAPQYSHVFVKVAGSSVKGVINYNIMCIRNCIKENTLSNEILLLKADMSVIGKLSTKAKLNSTSFEWVYSKEEESVLNLIEDAMKIAELPTTMLAIKEDIFEQGTNYTIRLRDKQSQDVLAEYSFKTDSFTYEGNCKVEPTSGIKGETNFDIICDGFPDMIFEFYDKNEEDLAEKVIFNGRMLGTSEYLGVLNDVKITRGNIEVYIVKKNSRLFIKKDLKVELSPLAFNEILMKEIRKNIILPVGPGSITTTMNYISFVPDILPEGTDKGEMLELLLQPIAKVTLNSVADVKLSASTLKIILQTLNKPSPIKVNVGLIGDILLIVDRQTDIIRKAVEHRDTSQWLSTKEVKLVATALLECLNAAQKSEHASITGQTEESMGFQQLFTLRQSAQTYGKIIDKSKDVLSYVQAPGLPPAKLTTLDKRFQIWALAADEDNPIPKILKKESDIPFDVSEEFLKTFSNEDINKDRDLFFQPALIENNIFSWSKSNVKSKLVSLSVATKKKTQALNKLNDLPSPIYVKVAMERNVTINTLKGSARQLDPTLSPVYLDLAITIHRIDILPKSFITIRFLFPPTTGSLRVLVLEDFRPDYEMMSDNFGERLKHSRDKAIIINSSNPQYPLRNRQLDVPVFLYMGVLPEKDVAVNESVDYEFEVTENLCQRWIDGQWSTIGCTVSEGTTSEQTGCLCNHLSIFAAAFPVPPQSIDPFGDAKLFLSVLDNPLVVVFVIILFIIYLLLVLWGRYKDNIDRYKGKVVVLADNFPEDECPYLIAVHTSARFNAGTTAHVGFKLMGNKANSRVHILSSERRKVLTRNSDDWFMIYTPKALGDIYEVHVWHDNYGSRPEWYCDKIVVYDLAEHVESLFIVEQWLALRKGDYPEALLMISTDTDILNIKRMFLDNSVIGFRDSHTMLSVFVRHPRSEVTRVQRVSILMLTVMVAMLCSIMFYKPDDENASDEYQYDVGTREIIISIECLFITGALTLVALHSFKRSSKVVQEGFRTTRHFRKDEVSERISRESIYQDRLKELRSEKDKTFYDNYVKYIHKYFKEPPLAPVHLWEGEKKVKRRMIWYIIAWLTCIIVIIAAAYLIMLYGLKLGFIQSQIWLTSLIMTMGEDIFVMSPGRIIFIAVLLSMAFQISTKVNIHGITVKDAMVARPANDLNYLNILLAKRSHPMYAPLSSSARLAHLRRKEIRRRWWDLIDFTNAVFFVVIVSAVIYRLWTSEFHTVDHLREAFSQSHLKQFGSVHIKDVRNISLVQKYMEFTFIEDLFSLSWYNNAKLKIDDESEGIRKYWVDDYIQKPISTPLLRQVRVVPGVCKNVFFKNMSHCLLKWSLDNKDVNVYGENWMPATYADTVKKDSPWEYTERQTFLWWTNDRFYGVFGTLYDVSGYNTFVGPTLKEAQKTLAELRVNNWQDWYTRACFLSTTVYNVNEQTFSQITILFEYFVYGSMASSIKVIPVSRVIVFGVWEYLFIFYAVYYVFRTGYLINRMGLMGYLKTLNNITRLLNVFLKYLTILFWCVHHRTSIKYAENYMKNTQELYFDFDEFIGTFSIMQLILSLLLCFAIARCFMLVRGGRRFLNAYYTLKIMLTLILDLVVAFLLLLLFCRKLQYLLHCQEFFRMKELILPQKMTAFVSNALLENNNVQIFILVRLVVMFFVHALLVKNFYYYYKIAKAYKPRPSDDFNFVTFIIDRVKRRFSKRRSYMM